MTVDGTTLVRQGDGPRRGVRRRRALVWLGVGAAAFVIGGGITAGVLLWQDKSDSSASKVESREPHRTEPSQGPSDGTTGGPSPSQETAAPDPSSDPSSEPTGTPAAPNSTDPMDDVTGRPTGEPTDSLGDARDPDTPPEGYRTARDPQGFSLAVPADWEREVRSGQIDYRGAGSAANSYLRIGIVRGTGQSAFEHFQELEGITSGRTGDYQRLALTANTFHDRPGARWEFTWVEKKTGRTMHAIDQAYVTADGTEYAIYYQGPAETFPVDREAFDTALLTWAQGG
ncbi:hypothetical protein AAHZ94_06330 [Streptomyces sp. HSW2009]|uniref:hypothetical protein n=1 Tax=Streptomyces sp. HSW2009 TaxID=3142890 RepID=UPI0032EF6D1D